MTKAEIKSKLRQFESARREKDRHREAFDKAENIEYEARKDLDAVFCELTGSKYGIVMIDGSAYEFGGVRGIHAVPVVDLSVFLDPDVPDNRCVKSINPDFNPADLGGIICAEAS